MNELIEIPEFSYDTINIIVKIRTFVNNIQRDICESSHSIIRFRCKTLNNKISIFFNKFLSKVFKSGGFHHHIKEKYLIYNPFDSIINIKKVFPKLNLDMFIKLKSDRLEFKYEKFLPLQINSLCYEVDYIEIREQVISYLIQKIGKTVDVLELQKLFSSVGNCSSYEEEINKKIKYLLELDLDTYLKELNSEIERKISIKEK